jgi:lipopolysaccharide biosynthesis glycosyltransferase
MNPSVNPSTPIPIFFSCDSTYLPFLAVSIRSLIDNASPAHTYRLCVLYTDIDEQSRARVTAMATDRCSIDFVDVKEAIAPVMAHFRLRDYYTISIYYRLFIPSLFPEYEKAIYLDCDVAVEGDISELYATDLGDGKLVAVVRDEIVADHQIFRTYVEEAVGVPHEEYFNSGMMVMNLKLFRALDIEGKFVTLLTRYAFPSVAPDQDYLNALCNGRVVYLDKSWNKMYSRKPYEGQIKMIHYNMFLKPWLYTEVPNGDIFWKYAVRTDFYEQIRSMQHSYGFFKRLSDKRALKRMFSSSRAIIRGENNFAKKLPCEPLMKELRSL